MDDECPKGAETQEPAHRQFETKGSGRRGLQGAKRGNMNGEKP
jgi:hypothetical protein